MSELNLILLGPPGAGKGTQAARLREDFALPYIGTGDLLREHKESETELGREAKRYMDNGDLVPDELVIAMILEKVEEEGDDGFLLDGFPRTIGQADALARELESMGRRLTAAMLIEAPDGGVPGPHPGPADVPRGALPGGDRGAPDDPHQPDVGQLLLRRHLDPDRHRRRARHHEAARGTADDAQLRGVPEVG